MNLDQAAEKAYDAALPFKWSDLEPKTRAVWVAFLAAAVADLGVLELVDAGAAMLTAIDGDAEANRHGCGALGCPMCEAYDAIEKAIAKFGVIR